MRIHLKAAYQPLYDGRGAPPAVLLLALGMLLKCTEMTASLVIVCPGLAIPVPAAGVVALPLQSPSGRDSRRRLGRPFLVT